MHLFEACPARFAAAPPRSPAREVPGGARALLPRGRAAPPGSAARPGRAAPPPPPRAAPRWGRDGRRRRSRRRRDGMLSRVSTSPGQTFSPPVTIRSSSRPWRCSRPPSSSHRASPVGSQPSVVRPAPAAVPIPAQQRRAPQLNLAFVADPHLHAREGEPVVDDPAAALGEPVSDHAARPEPAARSSSAALHPATPDHHGPVATQVDAGVERPGQLGGHDRDEAGARPAAPAPRRRGRAAGHLPAARAAPPAALRCGRAAGSSPSRHRAARRGHGGRTPTAASTAVRLSSTSRGRSEEPEVGIDQGHLGVRPAAPRAAAARPSAERSTVGSAARQQLTRRRLRQPVIHGEQRRLRRPRPRRRPPPTPLRGATPPRPRPPAGAGPRSSRASR